LDESLLQAEWPGLRDRLSAAMRQWDVIKVPTDTQPAGSLATSQAASEFATFTSPVMESASDKTIPLLISPPEASWKKRVREHVVGVCRLRGADV
jgi:hypothetical protein